MTCVIYLDSNVTVEYSSIRLPALRRPQARSFTSAFLSRTSTVSQIPLRAPATGQMLRWCALAARFSSLKRYKREGTHTYFLGVHETSRKDLSRGDLETAENQVPRL